MSLADRPRPTMLLLPGALRRHLYAFVWLPRDELTTSRRKAIAMMLEAEVGAPVSSWSVELGDGELALLRFTMPIDPTSKIPDVAALDAALVEMVRGWAPAVEAELIAAVGPGRATRLSLTYLPAMPEGYRARTDPIDGAADILRICELDDDHDRDARLYRSEHAAANQLHLKTYRLGGLIPLSEAVPVMENFGFRVLEELPTAVGGGEIAYIHDFLLQLPETSDIDAILDRADDDRAGDRRRACRRCRE